MLALQVFDKVGVSDINRKCRGQIEGAGTASLHYFDDGGLENWGVPPRGSRRLAR